MALSTESPRTYHHLLGFLLLGAALGASVEGCSRGISTPEESFKRFLVSFDAEREQAVWDSLSTGSKRAIREQLESIAKATGREPGDPKKFLFEEGELMILRKPESISVASPLSGEEVMLRVAVSGGESADIRMVREGSEWKVDLFGSMKDFHNYGFQVPSSTSAAGAGP